VQPAPCFTLCGGARGGSGASGGLVQGCGRDTLSVAACRVGPHARVAAVVVHRFAVVALGGRPVNDRLGQWLSGG
jgi:hypothetical protein